MHACIHPLPSPSLSYTSYVDEVVLVLVGEGGEVHHHSGEVDVLPLPQDGSVEALATHCTSRRVRRKDLLRVRGGDAEDDVI